jgi:hypothetical protein
MRGFKKLIASVLTTAIVASSSAAFAAVPDDVIGTRFEEPMQILSALGIMQGDESGKFRPDDTIIRSEVTKMVVYSMGLEDVAQASNHDTKFPDVAGDHWAKGYINVAASQGLIIGDESGNFHPNEKITYAEAMTMLVRALGYEQAAQSKGGYPQGYIVVGSNNGLGKNVTGASSEPISRGNVAFMTNNALTVNLMEQTGFGDNTSYEVVDKTLLEDKLKTTKNEGQIVAIENTSLTGPSSLKAGQVKIGDTVYNTAYNMNNLLGFNVTFYVRENDKTGDDEIILALPQKEKNSSVEIKADLFEGLTEKSGNKAIEYFKKDTDTKTTTAQLNSEAILIYNGKYEEMSDELLDMTDKAGSITLLDTDRDGKYDVVFVTEYYNMVVEEVSPSGRITDKYGKPSLKLDREDSNISFEITKGADSLEVADLNEWDVLSIAQSKDKALYTIVVTNNKVEGKITEIDDEGVVIGGTHYKVAANYDESLKLNMEGTFYLDVEGKIAAIDTTTRISSNYAYLLRAHAATDIDDKVTIKVFTKEGSEKSLEANEKIRFNGKSGQKAVDVVAQLKGGSDDTPQQLITFETNSEGKLIELNTAIDNTSTGKVDEDNFTKNHILSQAVYNEALKRVGNINLTDETIIFNIPENATDSSDYSIGDLSMFEDKAKYDVIVFDTADDFTAKAIIVTNSTFQTNAESPIAVVEKITTATNDDDEVVDKLVAYVDGEKVEIPAEDKGVLVKGEDNKPLQNGDIIQFKKNKDGEIVSFRLLFDITEKATEMESSPTENLDLIYGKVVNKFTSSINVTVNDGAVKNLQLSKDVKVYSVDTTKSKNNITVATIGDIQKFDEEENNRVFVKLYKDVVEEVVIIK